jgi:hypothetical protein
VTLRDRLAASRHARFVGREAEQALFRSALSAARLPFHVLFVYGPGGVGKTALLHAFAHAAAEHGVPAVYLDTRDVAPTPEAFTNAVARALEGAGPAAPGGDGAAGAPPRRVLLLDTFESVGALGGWLHRSFLPEADDELLVVLAGRTPPDPAWQADLGWQAEVRLLPLRNLSPAESEVLLEKQGVPAEARRAALAFTHGHPLALALVAEHSRQHAGRPFEPAASPDVVRTLLQRFLDDVPSLLHRTALEASALVNALTEPLLGALLDHPDVADLFAWLRGLSFVEEGPRGLFPHDLAREVLAADLRWRDAGRHAALHERARRHFTARLQHVRSEAERHEVIGAYVFLYRENAVVRPFFEGLRAQWARAGVRTAGPLRAEDAPALGAMVARHEGADAAAIAARWLRLQPEGVEVCRDDAGAPVGFLMTLALEAASAGDRAADPATAAAWQYLRGHAPLRKGERAVLFRFWMDDEAYQGLSATQSLVFGRMVRHYLATAQLAFSFLPCAEPDFWAPVFAFADLHRLPEADFAVGGRTYGVFGHDWRAVPPTRWLDTLAARAPNVTPAVAPPPRPPLLVLSAPDFAQAVHDALRDYARPYRLAESPLLRSRLVAERAVPEAEEEVRVEALRALLRAATEALDESPREAPYGRALRLTYLQPAPTQAVAAERLGVPFSTYRRHLKRGVERVTEALWRQEAGP